MSMSPARPHVLMWEAILAVDAPDDHSLQGVSSEAGPSPKLPGRAAGAASAPVYWLVALSRRNLRGSCLLTYLASYQANAHRW